jgi:predicted dehydrogenase
MTFSLCTIGCGSMASHAHGPAYAKYAAEHPDTNLAACCDLNAERAEMFRARFGYQRCYTDIAAMLKEETPDAVCLIAPIALTCELACPILEKGIPVLMEKPPGQSVAEIDRMIAAAEVGNAPSQVAFNRRTIPLLVRLKRLLEEVAPGAIQHLRLEFTRTGRADPDFSTTAIHGIDTARFLVGSDYQEIRFHYQPLPQFGEGVANVFLEALFQNGVTGHLHFCPMAGEIAERITLQADDQTFHLHLPIWNALDFPGRLRHLRQNACLLDTPCEIAANGGEGFEINGFYGENAAFLDAIRAGKPPAPDLKQARQSVEVMERYRLREEWYRPVR